MKRLLWSFAVLLTAASAAHAGLQGTYNVSPGSDDPNNANVVFSSANPTAVAIASSTLTQIDAAVNTQLQPLLTYRRLSVTVQNSGTSNVNVGYFNTGSTTTAGGYTLQPGDVWSWSVGSNLHLYAFSIAGSSGTLTVGGLGYKQN